jgi:hypothetical protein
VEPANLSLSRRKPVEAPFSKEAAKIPDAATNCIVVIAPAVLDGLEEAGVGCVVSRNHILTTVRAVEKSQPLHGDIKEGWRVQVRMPWQPDHPPLQTTVVRFTREAARQDLVLLESMEPLPRQLVAAQFAAMPSVTGKRFSAIGFPREFPGGTTAGGRFTGIERGGNLLRLESEPIVKLGGFRSTPLWAPNLRAFVGLVSGTDRHIALSASLLCKFYPDLGVQFKIPQADIPKINDPEADDPNVELFGEVSEQNGRRLTATIKERGDRYEVMATYECLGDLPPRGRFVTFITYPDFGEDYQIVVELDETGKATAEFHPTMPDFTFAAIGDAGDTRLTLNLETVTATPAEPSAERTGESEEMGSAEDAGTKSPDEATDLESERLERIIEQHLDGPRSQGPVASDRDPAEMEEAVEESTAKIGSGKIGEGVVGGDAQSEAPLSAAPPISPNPAAPPTPEVTIDVSAFRDGPSGYSSEFMAVGRGGAVEDQLRVSDYAERLAELIALRETKLPLAVGLFGNWGSGKSHFMNLLDQHMRTTADKARKEWEERFPNGGPPETAAKGPWCHQIVPVYFNAWHYVDTNLWASLVTHIFDRLFDHLKPKQDEFKKVQELLEQASGTAARATEELAIAQQEATTAQAELTTAKVTCVQQETFVRGLLDSLQELLPDVRKQEERRKAAGILGVEEELKKVEQLQQVVADARTTTGRAKSLWNSFLGQGWVWRIGWLAVAVGALFAGPWLVAQWNWSGGKELLAKWTAYLGPLLSLTGVALAKANSALKTMEDWAAKAREAQQLRRQTDPAVQAAEQQVQVAQARVQAAQVRVAEAEAKQKQLREEAMNLAPGRRISRFIEQRAQSSDYKGQLGLVSLARRDFEELSNLFANTKALERVLEELKQKAENAEKEAEQFDKAGTEAGATQRTSTEKVVAEKDEQTKAADEAEAASQKKKVEELKRKALAKRSEAEAARNDAKQLQKASDSIDRIVLFVDDLDRCQPAKVVDVLQAVHLLLAFPLFAVVVGVDQRCLRQSIQEQFRGLLTPIQKNGRKEKAHPLVVDGERPTTPLDYLEKIFHVPFHLPAMEKEGFGDLIEKLTKPIESAEKPSSKKVVAAASQGEPGSAEARDDNAAQQSAPAIQESGSPERSETLGNQIVDGAVKQTQTTPTESGPVRKEPQPKQEEVVVEIVGSIPLERWERDALKDYHLLIQTPRGATRLLNTYRLVRAGIPKDEWTTFCGNQKDTGEFRIALLLLAASAGCPAVSPDWFKTLRKNGIGALSTAEHQGREWTSFANNFNDTVKTIGPTLDQNRLCEWLGRVERFTF